jgi:epoxyqueuosine reductase
LPELTRRATTRSIDPATILMMSKQEFAAAFAGSALKRARRRGLARNAAVVLGNRDDPSDFGPLARALAAHDEPLARGHAAWALGRIGGAAARRALSRACDIETDSYVWEEIRAALAHGSP